MKKICKITFDDGVKKAITTLSETETEYKIKVEYDPDWLEGAEVNFKDDPALYLCNEFINFVTSKS